MNADAISKNIVLILLETISSYKREMYQSLIWLKLLKDDMSRRIQQTNAATTYQEYDSYEDCDSQFIRNTLPGLTPIWMTGNFSAVSKLVYDENDTYGRLLIN